VEEVRVLVVDDQAPFRLAAKATLARTPGFTLVGEAADGTEVVAAAAANGADLVLMDVNMPVMNGIEATQALLAARPGTVVFLCSTYAIAELPASAGTSGARAYINKEDLSPQLLAEHWARAISSSPADGLFTG
jgi:DNA-binding NarL/FixJ family response regulator